MLQNWAPLSIKSQGMSEHYLRSFYIRSTNLTQIKTLRPEVLSNLARESNIPLSCGNSRPPLAAWTRALWQPQSRPLKSVTPALTAWSSYCPTVMNSWLQHPCSSRSYCIWGRYREIIKHLAKLTDNIQVPMAQASILWLSSEDYKHVSRIAPDDPGKMAKPFTAEEVIHLAARLYPINSKQTKLLTQYALSLAKYNRN